MKKKIYKIIAVFLVIDIFSNAIFPTVAYALTGGPTQPEVVGFTPIGTSDMVNNFSGDFNYNIPLMDVGGYPLNISYQSGISMDQEASWVGLGWSLNPGVIDRSMRSLPDDFNGDKVEKEFNLRPNITYGVKFYPEGELFGKKIKGTQPGSLQWGLGLTYNNYNGYGFSGSLDLKLSANTSSKTKLTGGLGLSAGSESGVGIAPSLSYEEKGTKDTKRDRDLTGKVGLAFNSRAGLQALSLSSSVKGQLKIGDKEKKHDNRMASGGSSISFASPSYIPQSGHSMLNTSVSLSATFGGDVVGFHPEARLEGFYTGQYLMHHSETFPAYGYMFSQNASDDKVLLDFNREKDGAFTEHTPALPLTNLTYDVYAVSGQGIGGMYRAHRSDIGIVYDSKSTTVSAGADLPGIEVGAGNVAHMGVNLSLNESNSTSGKWTDDNSVNDNLGFKGVTDDPFYEPYYFKQAGEKNAESDTDFFEGMGGFDPVRIELNHNPESVPAKASYNKAGTNMAKNTRNKRAGRNEVMALLTASEANIYAGSIENYAVNNFTTHKKASYKNIFKPNTIAREADFRQSYHTSQITTYRADGAKYVYGIPAYNIKQDERTFAIEGGLTDIASGLVSYLPGDDKVDNKKGLDNYFERSVMPAYAHSYLLTAVLSVDYVDVTGDGPTDDDLGTYTKINYSKTANDYKWRVPYKDANYNEGFKSIPGDKFGDDKASYIYGEKELWYIHSIETKNYVAQFTLAPRMDGYGVKDESGGWSPNAQPMQKLMKITLYAKQDLLHNPDPIPLKTVHFEYDYSLCKNIDNNLLKFASGNAAQDKDENGNPSGFTNEGGKLTLKKIYFTYGKSMKGKLSPYEFDYSNSNPDYNIKGYDRWGNYKPNTAANPAAEFPYTDQTDVANDYAKAWHLTNINLPSGGVVNIDYEADDYAYVQNKRAMQMFKVLGTSVNAPTQLSDLNQRLYEDISLTEPYKSRNYLVFALTDQSITTPEMLGKAYFQEKDGTKMENLYFKFLVDLGRIINVGDRPKEYVPGYADIVSYGLFTDGAVRYGWVKLDEGEITGSSKVNVISQTAWNFTKLYLPILAYAQPRPSDSGVMRMLKIVASTLKSIVPLFTGFYNQMRIDGMAKKFDADKSYIRLYNPINAKKGGGSRVKELTLADNWKSMTKLANSPSPYEDAIYGQTYNYTTTDEYGAPISSGVAAYEPLIGGDENPFREPVPFEKENLWVPNDDYYQEKPYGESFFPGASVGYTKVTVKNLSYNNVKRNATGKVVNEFYTAKDFPTITRQTTIDPVRKKPNAILKLLKIKARDYMTVSQGFVVELNDMHGKPKATWVYPEGKEEYISGIKYIYKTAQQDITMPSYVNNQIKQSSLDNNILAMEKNGAIGVKMVGVDYDFVTDMRESKTTSRSGGIGGNLETFLVALFPGVIPTIFPSYSQEKVRFRSAVTTKIINRYGLLEETIAYDLGSMVSTKNKMLDAETGEVLLTETKNQFDDPVYALNYPAHTVYEGMGPAYKNIGVTLPANISNPDKYLVPGDEIEVIGANAFEPKAWVKSVSATAIEAIDIDGVPVDLNGKSIRVIRSGRRNQQNTVIGSVISKNNPLNSTQEKINVNTGTAVINANATEFSDKWAMFCQCSRNPYTTSYYNPYISGVLGNWRKAKSQVLLAGRTQSRMNDNTSIRTDGTYTSFTAFWSPPANNLDVPWVKNTTNWQTASEVTAYSPYGMELENKDALGIYSSAIYGYNNTLPLAVSANAQYREIGFDSFEDYDFDDCADEHFSFESFESSARDKVNKTKSHTGKRSVKVDANSEIKIKNYLSNCPRVILLPIGIAH